MIDLGYVQDTTAQGPDLSPPKVRVHEDGERDVFYDAMADSRVTKAWISTLVTVDLEEVR